MGIIVHVLELHVCINCLLRVRVVVGEKVRGEEKGIIVIGGSRNGRSVGGLITTWACAGGCL